jgi:hypothetical protein
MATADGTSSCKETGHLAVQLHFFFFLVRLSLVCFFLARPDSYTDVPLGSEGRPVIG